MTIFAQSLTEMQFNHPEVLWCLFLLLIPIFIHLFQLRRFKKTPFTNVKVLQKIQSESRRSNTLKKMLLLLSRLALLTGLIIAFAQPFMASKSALQKKEIVIYLDDSFSMQAKKDNATLLENATQELINSVPANEHFTLFTNEKVFKNAKIEDIQNELLALPFSPKQLKLNEIALKANSLFDSNRAVAKNLVVISDFQQRMASHKMDSTAAVLYHFTQLVADVEANISIDTAYLMNDHLENMDLTVLLSGSINAESTPVSLYNDDKLLAKTSAVFNKNHKSEVSFTIPSKQPIKGKIEIADGGLTYDNRFYFSIDEKEKIKVMAVGTADASFLTKIFTKDEFEFSDFNLQNLNYNVLEEQNLIILNELEAIPGSLVTVLKSFLGKGGNLTIIPSTTGDLVSYNTLLTGTMGASLSQLVNADRNITDIAFVHPLFKNVFEKNVSNFQYPQVSQFYKIRTSKPNILSYQDKNPFLVGGDGEYVFTASIKNDNSNFKNSPLVVPVFYNMGMNSLKLPQLYHIIGNAAEVDVPVQLAKDHILKVSKDDMEIIPQQRALSNKVTLSFQEIGLVDGNYVVTDSDKALKNLSFNYPRKESELIYLDLAQLTSTSKENSISSLFQKLQNENSIIELWKWFVILALLFLMIEILIQKYFK